MSHQPCGCRASFVRQCVDETMYANCACAEPPACTHASSDITLTKEEERGGGGGGGKRKRKESVSITKKRKEEKKKKKERKKERHDKKKTERQPASNSWNKQGQPNQSMMLLPVPLQMCGWWCRRASNTQTRSTEAPGSTYCTR